MTRAEKRALNKAKHVNRGAANRGSGEGRGGPASGIPAKSRGWGGAANGASTSRIEAGPMGDEIRKLRWDKDHMEQKEEVAAEMRGVLYGIATDAASNEHARLAAADKLLDRIEGKPIARSVTTTVDDVSQLSDLELTAEIARLERELGEAAPRAGEAKAGEPPGGVPPIH